MKRVLGGFVLVVVLLFPFDLRGGQIGNLPIDLMLSDVLVLLSPLFFLTQRRTAINQTGRLMLAMVLFLIYYCLLMASWSFWNEYGVVVFFSSLKFVKPFFLFFVGYWICERIGTEKFFSILALTFWVLMVSLFVNSLLKGHGRWGEFLGDLRLSGFPNSPMSFLAFFVPLILARMYEEKGIVVRMLLFGGFLCAVTVITLSLSRSSFVVCGVGVLIFLFYIKSHKNRSTSRIYLASMVLLVVGLIAVYGLQGELLMERSVSERIASMVQNRLDSTFSEDDAFSGRTDIWRETLELIAESPVFGYRFRPFVELQGQHGTAHQQYLEIFYKIGFFGSFFYLFFVVVGIGQLKRLSQPHYSEHHAYWLAIFSGTIGLCVGNLSQPNFSFSLTGNSLFCLIGMATERVARLEALEKHRKNEKNRDFASDFKKIRANDYNGRKDIKSGDDVRSEARV